MGDETNAEKTDKTIENKVEDTTKKIEETTEKIALKRIKEKEQELTDREKELKQKSDDFDDLVRTTEIGGKAVINREKTEADVKQEQTQEAVDRIRGMVRNGIN